MGTYLSKPNTEKESHEGEDDQFKFGVSAMQGWRISMEDAHATVLNVQDAKGQPSSIGFFGVFDGHGGKEVALFAAKYLQSELVNTEGWNKGNLEEAIQQAYMNLDSSLGREDTWDELSKFAKAKKTKDDGADMDDGDGAGDLPEEIRNVLAARCAILEEENGIYGHDDFEDAPFDPMEAIEDSKDITEADVMTRDDSDEEDEKAEGIALVDDEAESESRSSGSSHSEESIGFKNTLKYRGPSAGCTAVVALVANDLLVVANAGDSRCVASRNGVAHAMTHDHKPTDDVEAARIHKAGGFVTEGRVNGSLNLSRALGDMEFKRTPELGPAQQMITADPDIRTLKLQPGDDFLVLACDGIWDVLTNQAAVNFVRERLRAGMTPKAICEEMCDHCLAPDVDGCGEGCDNMSAMVVVLKNFVSQDALKGPPIPPPMPPPAV